MKEKILEILREINPYEDIDENSQLIEEAIIESLTLVLLISEMEQEFNIRIPEDKLQPEYFETVSKIEELINALL